MILLPRIGAREGIALPFRNQKAPDHFPMDVLEALPEKYCRAQVGCFFAVGAVVVVVAALVPVGWLADLVILVH